MEAFWDLSTERQFGPGGMGPIPWSKMVSYVDRRGIDPQMAAIVIQVLRQLDEIYLKRNMKNRDAKIKKPPEKEVD